MKIRLTWIRVTAAAAIATAVCPWAAAQGQYSPYPTTQQSTAAQPYPAAGPYGTQPPQTSIYPATSTPNAAQSRYVPTTQPAAQPEQRYASMAGTPYTQTPYQPPRYQQPASNSPYASLARQMNDASAPTPASMPASMLPSPTPTMNGSSMPAGGMQNNGGQSPYPTADPMSGYMSSDPGCANGSCGCQEYGYGYDACLDGCGGGSQWFGGVYALYMTRNTPAYRSFTAGVDSVATGTPYFPQASDIENQSDCAFLTPHWQGGLEVRLGCTFGIGDGCDYGDSCGDCGTSNSGCNTGCDNACGCQPCCAPCCQQMFAWEVAWWGLEDDNREQYVDGPVVGNFRYYGMVNFAGLQYDPGTGVQPVNDFYNYQIPITGPGTETVLAQRVRTNFNVQNFELNFMRLPLYGGGCGCDCGPAFSVTSLCGVRYFRIEDDFEFGTEWDDGGGSFDGWRNGTNELFQDIDMENNLVGLQLGANMNYCVATRWNFFWDTNFGVYNNWINQNQRIYNPINGNATFVQDGREASVESDKDSVAFLGELRVGGGYSFTNHWRGILAYRAIGVSGVALSQDQIKPYYSNYSDVARVNNDGSLIVHGVQLGIECVY